MAECALATTQQDSLVGENSITIDEAYQRTLPELMALPIDELLVVNFDIPSAICTALGTVRRVEPWRQKLVAELPGFDIKFLDCLGQYTLALMAAQSRYHFTQQTPLDLRKLAERTSRQYLVLLADARALAARGFIQPEALAKLRGCRSYAAKALGLSGLVHILSSVWPDIEGKTALTLNELRAADQQALMVFRGLAHQKQQLSEPTEVAEMRQRAFTVFSNAYGQVRRAIRYLCADSHEADELAPTLYPRRRVRRKVKTPDGAADNVTQPTVNAVVAATPEVQSESLTVPFTEPASGVSRPLPKTRAAVVTTKRLRARRGHRRSKVRRRTLLRRLA